MEIVVDVLKNGYYERMEKTDVYLTDCTCTLLRAPNEIIIIDPLGSYSRNFLVDALKNLKLECSSINTVVVTHGHSDHVGNLGLFPNAKHIVGYDVNIGEKYYENDLRHGCPYQIIDNSVEVWPTPGHTCHDVSVIVKGACYNNLHVGTIAIVGDLFENSDDDDMWEYMSSDPAKQLSNRQKITDIADLIIPGHGPPFFAKRFTL